MNSNSRMEVLVGAAVFLMAIGAAILPWVFIGWVVIKLMQHFGIV